MLGEELPLSPFGSVDGTQRVPWFILQMVPCFVHVGDSQVPGAKSCGVLQDSQELPWVRSALTVYIAPSTLGPLGKE